MTRPELLQHTTSMTETLGQHDLLQQLIKEGLTTTVNGGHTDPSRFRKLLEVLFQACILKPAPVSSTPSLFEQAGFTLAILVRQTSIHPELLSNMPARDEAQIPLYKWVLPHLISSVIRWDAMGGAEKLVEDLMDAAVHVMQALASDLAEDQASFAHGPRRAVLAARGLTDFVQACIEGRPALLFGSLSLNSSPLAALVVLEILLRLRLPFTDSMSITACHQLTAARTFAQQSYRLHSRFNLCVAHAWRCKSAWSSALMESTVFVLTGDVSEASGWSEAVCTILDCVAVSDPLIRRDTWWLLLKRSTDLHMMTGESARMINHLLTPVPPLLPLATLRSFLPSHMLEEWADNATKLNTPTALEFAHLRQTLDGAKSGHAQQREHGLAELNNERVKALIQERMPQVTITAGKDAWGTLESLVSGPVLGGADLDRTLGLLPELVCAVCGCGRHRPRFDRHIPVAGLDLWMTVFEHSTDRAAGMRALSRITDHMPFGELAGGLQLPARDAIIREIQRCMRCPSRQMRIISGRIYALVFQAQYDHPDPLLGEKNRITFVRRAVANINGSAGCRETAILLLTDIGRHIRDESSMVDVLEALLLRLGSHVASLRSLAYTELLSLAKSHSRSPYMLFSPFLEHISEFLASHLVKTPDIVAETMQLIGYSRQAFLEMTLRYTVPFLILTTDKEALELVASVLKRPLGPILLDHTAEILAKIFLDLERPDEVLEFLQLLLRRLTRGQSQISISTSSLMTTCIVPFVVSLVMKLGDEDATISQRANGALLNAQAYQSEGKTSSGDLGTFLKPHMLGIISQLNDALHDIQGKKTVVEKRRIIRSLGQLINTVGDTMASFSPQIMASLQSTLGIGELRLETLKTWALFVDTLRYNDIGPFIGRTTGALVAHWGDFSTEETFIAVKIIECIAGNAQHLGDYLDEVVGMDSIPQLSAASAKLTGNRRTLTVAQRLEKVLERIDSRNTAVATTSVRELRGILIDQPSEVARLSRGDSFDKVVANTMRGLLAASIRDGDCSDLREVSFECLGILGALDSDRMAAVSEVPRSVIMQNFNDHDESVEFAISLIRNLLVGAFRATNDTKHQNHLAFAIQELLKFCGFDAKILQSHSIPLKTRQRWQKLPKDQLETLSPLLESRFSLNETSSKHFVHPIYSSAPTYREWMQMWTTDLIARVMSLSTEGKAGRDSPAIFGVFRGVHRGQDVTVAHHILPHLVLTVLLSGDITAVHEIRDEIKTVLQDQVNPVSGQDKRNLSAQVIFDLMDHLSHWQRQQRVGKPDRNDHIRVVDEVLSSIDTELMANAALKSRAYARSLRSFEQRILQLRSERRTNFDLHAYFERLHLIYAELDEPDGMGGVSTFVLSPSLEHQIREHEMTGRWTSAQSCWEVRIQQSSEDVSLHIGLLKCLRNLGHYDTMRTHIQGVLSRELSWSHQLAPLQAEAAWITGDWETVKSIGKRASPLGRGLLALHQHADPAVVLSEARRALGGAITSSQYSRSYDHVLQLHLIREIEIIQQADKAIQTIPEGINRRALAQQIARTLAEALGNRLLTASPAFRVQEAILTIRRAAFGLAGSPLLRSELGHAWVTTSKFARKAGYEQTAYSAALQAEEAEAPFAFIQQVKLVRHQGEVYKALTDLHNTLTPMMSINVSEDGNHNFSRDRSLAKGALLEARWANETDRFTDNEIIDKFRQAISLAPNLESPYYHLGHYYDNQAASAGPDLAPELHHQTCHHYFSALQYGVKYIYQTMPRLLTIWLDMGENKELKKLPAIQLALSKINKVVDTARRSLPSYQFLTAFPQIVSRICHSNKDVATILIKVMALVIESYPKQALWPTVGVMQSRRTERKSAANQVLARAKAAQPSVSVMIEEAGRLSAILLRLAEDKVDDKRRDLSAKEVFPYVISDRCFPSRMIMPLQDALTGSLPATPETVRSHNPFPSAPVQIIELDDRVEIMPSLQRPKKLIFKGDNGRKYPFLCKPHDDLRKDARLMDFNAMINKLLNRASESRRRHLYIRTYAVTPLNEECGLVEWVANTNALKGILEKGYARYNKRVYTNELHKIFENTRKDSDSSLVRAFQNSVLPSFQPTVFYEWFLQTWPEPSAWLASRMSYSRTLAVMSMIGFVLGLGDRHGENILFDGLTGDTVHVDLNCLFERGRTFEIPERVPFRLTHNMVDALGVTGVEGVFRKAAEITLDLLRTNSDSLMSVLEAFVHDPLVEWTKSHRAKTDRDIRISADRNLKPIRLKLRGSVDHTETFFSVPSQVEKLIKQATSPNNLGLMYQGWAPWL